MMEKQVVLVTDSTADIPRTLIEELGIYVIPLKVHFDGETFLDGESITPPLFYQKVSQVRDLPTTSQPSPLDFVSLYERIVEEHPGSHIVSIHLSGALSGTVQSAHIAREMVAGKIPVTVIDSKKASYAIGIIVVAAAEKAKKGVPVDPLLQYAWDLVGNTHGGDAAERLNQNRKRFYPDGSDPLAFSLFFVAYLPPPAIPPPPRKGGKTTAGNSDGGGGHPLLHLYGEQKRRCSHVANLSPQLRYDFHLRSTGRKSVLSRWLTYCRNKKECILRGLPHPRFYGERDPVFRRRGSPSHARWCERTGVSRPLLLDF